MNRTWHFTWLALLLCVHGSACLCAGTTNAHALHETFDSLQKWKPLSFPKIDRHSQYNIIKQGTNGVLKASSSASASGIVLTSEFDIEQHSVLQWRWNVDHVLEKGDATTKSGDDYPLRIYVMFAYDPATADVGLTRKAQYALARKLYGEYPPHSAISYIWANKHHRDSIIPNAYSDRAMMIIKQSGATHTGKWISETVNIREDYQRAFGSAPPAMASIAIMADTDNTGEKSLAYLDDLILRPAP